MTLRPLAPFAVALAAALLTPACAPAPGAHTAPAARAPLPAEQEAFWSALEAHCGAAYEGVVREAPAGDEMREKRLVMHVRERAPTEIRIPFHVGDDRSRTWVLTRSAAGLRLKHDHRHEDGSEDEITQYGGDTGGPGLPTRQEFRADDHTASLIPAAATNVWTVAVEPGERFVYALRREGTDRRFRVEFDLARPVAPPPPPWGER